MKKCLIWGTSITFKENYHLIQYYEKTGQISVIGITSEQSYYESLFGYPFIEKSNIDIKSFDILIVMARKSFPEIQKEVARMGIEDERIVPVRVMAMPGFEFDKYEQIKKNVPTIIAPNCWGGLTYSSLALPFKSPFINMKVNHDDYLKFLKKPQYYLNCPLEFEKMVYTNSTIDHSKREFPVARLDDIVLEFVHYHTFDEAVECWKRRKERIDWNNTIVMFFDDEADRINEFLKLPYKNKICFASYPSDEKEVISIDCKKIRSDASLYHTMTQIAMGAVLYYDVFDLILNNKATLIAKIK
jgi:uncharacterized protein (DUF1919 family)